MARPLARASRFGQLAIGLAIVAGVGLALVRLAAYSAPREVVWAVLAMSVGEALLPAGVALAMWLIAYRALAGVVAARMLCSLAAALGPWLVASLALGAFVNRRYLPGFWQVESLVANALLAAVLVAALLVAAPLLVRWRERSWLRAAGPGVLGWLIVGAAVAAVVGLGMRPGGSRAAPNVIVLVIDVLRADRLGCYGYTRDTSPHIDAFARDAVLFEQAVSQSTFTKTSVASLLTGLNPHRHGVYEGSLQDRADAITSDVLVDELATLAEAARDAGWLTAAWVENAQLRAYMGFDQGFALYRDQPGPIERIAREFRGWSRRWAGRRPFLAYLHFLDLHGPYRPRPPWDTRFMASGRAYHRFDWDEWRLYRRAVAAGEVHPTADEVEDLVALYDGQLAYIDSVVGSILHDLKAAGLYDDSLIVLTSDHGDAFLEHGFLAHSNTPYEELIRVPLLVKLPGSEHAGRRVEAQVGLVDVVPSLLELVGVPAPAEIDGRSFVGLLSADSAAPARSHFSEYGRCIAVREGGWKYIACADREPELYDLVSDPGETTNLIGARPDVAGTLERRASAGAQRRRELGDRERVIVDPATADELRALGYL